MNLDETVFMLVHPDRPNQAGAVGVKPYDSSGNLVGVYLDWKRLLNPLGFLEDVLGHYEEVRLFTPYQYVQPGLVCNMSAPQEFLKKVDDKLPDYPRFRVDFLALRAERPAPHLSLNYDHPKQQWDARILSPDSLEIVEEVATTPHGVHYGL